MDRFPKIFREDEWKRLEIKPKQLETVVSRLLSEFNLDLAGLEEIKGGDFIAIALNKLGEETKSLVRARSYVIGLEREDVEDLYEDMLSEGATSAVFITSSHFTKEAKEFVKHIPLRLVDGVELGGFLKEHIVMRAELAFLSGFTDERVVNYFKKHSLKRFLGIFGSRETIGEVDRRYMPVGQFSVKRITRDVETTRYIYVDLNSGTVFHMEGNMMEEDDFVKRILDLPPESRMHLLDLIKHGELEHAHMKGKPLEILEKERLVWVQGKSEGRGIFDILIGEITDIVSIIAREVTATGGKEATGGSGVETKKYVRARMVKPNIDGSYDIGRFIESGPEIDPEFDPDPVNYSPEDVVNVLKNVYRWKEISFVQMAYLPYYRCKYVSQFGKERFKKLFTPKFKKFVPKPTEYTWLYRFIDKFPAIPYLAIALGYLFLYQGGLEKTRVFSSAFIFLFMALVVGVLLKMIFRTERRIPRYGGTIVKHGFPSIHALASIGATAFVYFIDPRFVLLLAPLGLLYMYSRIKLGVHSERDIVGGAIIGLAIGIFCGIYVLEIDLGQDIENIFNILFFAFPIVWTIAEQRIR